MSRPLNWYSLFVVAIKTMTDYLSMCRCFTILISVMTSDFPLLSFLRSATTALLGLPFLSLNSSAFSRLLYK